MILYIVCSFSFDFKCFSLREVYAQFYEYKLDHNDFLLSKLSLITRLAGMPEYNIQMQKK